MINHLHFGGGLESAVWGSGFTFRVFGASQVENLWFTVYGLVLRVLGSGFGVEGSWLRVHV